ncbi:glycerol-3-phosphate dehydrogenase, anaerobic, C subunit [Desulfosporosinus orientis DSM 765]|uniref:Glycerol-3-phosphate dehydrogenase, anaerobic, C subunit n=2 Tax=Desulfosporosinus orientis TaxID=1563 RepID=G7WGA5_DESOD|nr:glycerol-3-phosphate dehydrogenase, anaerobic, C subunit [Desulfosporosinus orientis DSM 765]
MDGQDKVSSLDACIKCSACTALCPVAAVYPSFPGPKSLGPDAERFRLEGIATYTRYLKDCSNCKTCEVTCPSGVRITDMILRAREMALQEGQTGGKDRRRRVRDRILGRAEYLGRLGTVFPNLTNEMLKLSFLRGGLENALGISRYAPLPAYKPKFKPTKNTSPANSKQVVYFPGCFVTYNDSLTGLAVVRVLEHQGYDVIVPAFGCCGVPLQANGEFEGARKNVRKNLSLLNPYLQAGIPVITSCTSCSLALKEEYPKSRVPGGELIGQQTYDLFEFLWFLHERGELKKDFQEVTVSLGYHAPCHLKAQGIGIPSLRLLRLIPGVQVTNLDSECCGLSGSYGYKREKYPLAMEIGGPLFARVQAGVTNREFQSIITECGGCQVQIQHGSGIEIKHPIWIFLKAYGLSLT